MSLHTQRRRLLRAGAGLAAAPGAVLAGLCAAHATPAEPLPPAEPALGDRVHWPAVPLLDGRTLAPLQPGGAASVVVFFLTTCPFCARHNVHLQKLHEQARGQPLRVLAVAQDREPDTVRRYLRQRGFGFDTSMDAAGLRAVLSRKPGVPLTCVVDRQQRLREVIPGEMFEEDVLELARWAQR